MQSGAKIIFYSHVTNLSRRKKQIEAMILALKPTYKRSRFVPKDNMKIAC